LMSCSGEHVKGVPWACPKCIKFHCWMYRCTSSGSWMASQFWTDDGS
jgi:hypothetical protein